MFRYIRREPRSLGILIAFPLFIYIVLRALHVPPYSDEVITFFTYVQTGDFQPFYAHVDANNHVLNSLLAHASYLIFGNSIFALRLPNVLFFLLYLYFAWQIRNLFRSNSVGLLWFITICTCHYLITFFHLARGYGISMALLLGALYHLLAFVIIS